MQVQAHQCRYHCRSVIVVLDLRELSLSVGRTDELWPFNGGDVLQHTANKQHVSKTKKTCVNVMRCGYHRPLITCASKKHNVHAMSLHHCPRLPGIWLVLPNGIFPSAMLSLLRKLIWKPADVWVLLRYMQEADNVQPHHHKASIPKNTATTKQVAVTTATLIKQASYIVGWRECAYTQTSRKPRSHTEPLLVAPFIPVRDKRCFGISITLCGL